MTETILANLSDITIAQLGNAELTGLSQLSTLGFVQRTGTGAYTAAALTSSQITTALGFTFPLAVAYGGTGASTASGTSLDNITGFNSTGFIQRTGTGTYSIAALTSSQITTALGFTFPLAVAYGGIGTGVAGGGALDNITGFSTTGFVQRTGSGAYSVAALTGGQITTALGFTFPLGVANGGTGTGTAGGAALDNITGFSTTGFVQRTGTGTYSIAALTSSQITTALAANAITNSYLAQMAANTIKGNNTGSTANAADLSLSQVIAMLGIPTPSRNINGLGRVNQLVTAVAVSTSPQYIADMWEGWMGSAAASGNMGCSATALLAFGNAVGFAGTLGTSATAAIYFRTKIEQAQIVDQAGGNVTVQVTAYQDSGSTVQLGCTVLSANAANNFSSMSNSLSGAAQNVPSGAATNLTWTFNLSTLTNAGNGICVQFGFSMPSGLTSKNLLISGVAVQPGSTAQPIAVRDFADELRACQRYYWKSFALGTAPAQAVGGNTGELSFPAVQAGTHAQQSPTFLFPGPMIATPTVTFYNPVSSNAQVRDESANADCSGTAVVLHAPNSVSVACTAASGTVIAGNLGVHVTADARL